MPRENFVLILAALALYLLCSRFTIRDRILVENLHMIQRKALVEPSSKLLFEGAMTGMTRQLNTKLGDVYSAYIPPSNKEDYEASLENRFDGIGIVYRQDPIDKGAEILYSIHGSPAFEAGIRSGDRILSVNGQETKGLSFAKIAELFRGENDQPIRLVLRRFGKTEEETFTVRRSRILKDSVEGDRMNAEGKRVFRLETEPEIAYLRITTFSDRTGKEVREVLQRISAEDASKPVRGLVLDLRDNGGGYVSTCVEAAGLFLEATPTQDVVVSTRYRDGSPKYAYDIPERSRIWTLPMVVLIDGETASAAEILSAALQDYHRAKIVGTRSFGKGVVQEIFPLPLNSGTLQLTDASYWRPSNKNIHRAHDAGDDDEWGVTPDPEGLVKISESQRHATLQIRDRRSNFYAEDTDKLLEAYLKRVPEEIEQFRKEMRDYREAMKKAEEEDSDDPEEEEKTTETETETKTEPEDDDKPFVLRGNAPYYDPQLDRALELLKGISNTVDP